MTSKEKAAGNEEQAASAGVAAALSTTATPDVGANPTTLSVLESAKRVVRLQGSDEGANMMQQNRSSEHDSGALREGATHALMERAAAAEAFARQQGLWDHFRSISAVPSHKNSAEASKSKISASANGSSSSSSSSAQSLDAVSKRTLEVLHRYGKATKRQKNDEPKHQALAPNHPQPSSTATRAAETAQVSDSSWRLQRDAGEERSNRGTTANRLPPNQLPIPARQEAAVAGMLPHQAARRVSISVEERPSGDSSWVAVRQAPMSSSYPRCNTSFWKELRELVQETESAQREVPQDSEAFRTLQDELDNSYEMQRKLQRNSVELLLSRARQLRQRFQEAEQNGYALTSIPLEGSRRHHNIARGSVAQPIMIEQEEDQQNSRSPSAAAAAAATE